eukprot:1552908-Alexandrium_andersonii.AAC.1
MPADTRACRSLGPPQLVPAPQPASAGRPLGYSPPCLLPRADPGLACHRLPRVPGCSCFRRLGLPEGWHASGCHVSPGL